MNGSWVDPRDNEMKQLQRTLQEKESLLENEQMKVQNVTSMYQQMQREIAEAKQREQRIKNDFQV